MEFYKGLFLKAAAIYRSIIVNHPFIDGNKRTATLTLGVFLANNGYYLDAPIEEVIEYALMVAKNEVRDINIIAQWIKNNSIAIADRGKKNMVRKITKRIRDNANQVITILKGKNHNYSDNERSS